MKRNYKQSEEFIVFRTTLWRKGFTIKEFSEKIGMTRQNIYHSFQNKTTKTIDRILEEAFNL